MNQLAQEQFLLSTPFFMLQRHIREGSMVDGRANSSQLLGAIILFGGFGTFYTLRRPFTAAFKRAVVKFVLEA